MPVVASGAGRRDRAGSRRHRVCTAYFPLHAGKPDDLRPLADIADIISIDLIDFEPKEFPSPASA